MNFRLALLLLAFSGLAAVGQPNEPAQQPPRDPKGFLPVAIVPAESSPAPVAAPTAVSTNPAPGSGSASSNYVLDDKHKLMPGDWVSFKIEEDRTNAVALLVAESAELDVPYLGRVSVKNKTCKQLANEIKVALDKDYYYGATVIIGLNSLTRVLGTVYVIGPVLKQGPVLIPANETFTVSKAILLAGGFGDFASKTDVKVIRKTPSGTVTLLVNVKNVMERGKIEEDIVLEPDDFIMVRQSKINW